MSAPATDSAPWTALLETEKRGGHPKNTFNNVATILRHDERWTGVVAYDERAEKTRFKSEPPWPADLSGCDRRLPRDVTDQDTSRFMAWLEREHHVTVGGETALRAFDLVASEHAYDPVQDYFDALRWDGTPRLDGWLSVYCGAEASEYTRAVGARWLISAVARTYRPGSKADCALVLEGPQGQGKSSVLRCLAGEWFSDEIAKLGSKDAGLMLLGRLIVELSELDALGKAELTEAKAFLSRDVDRYRPPYGKRVTDHPRRCVFAGTTNETEYLRDASGNRRFWPVACGPIALERLEADRDQLWAEAVTRFSDGEAWHLNTPGLEGLATEAQAARQQSHPWEVPVLDFVDGRAEVTLDEVLTSAVKKPLDQQGQKDQKAVASILRANGWKSRQVRKNKRTVRIWEPLARPL